MSREVISGLAMRIVGFSLPILIVTDLFGTLETFPTWLLLWMFVCIMVAGFGADVRRIRRRQAQGHAEAADSPKFLQFRLRTMMLVIALIAVYCTLRFSPGGRYQHTVLQLRSAGVRVTYDTQSTSWPGSLVGVHPFSSVKQLTLTENDGAQYVAALGEVPEVWLLGSGIGDGTLRSLARLNRLDKLVLQGTSVTAPGVDQLRRALPECKIVFAKLSITPAPPVRKNAS